ncbi:YbfB/YjiJ family MFS transporter [Deinococcus sp. AJ005]|uniref:YbfB/YjiJ family MFS transporter n=2 Tax=Deinococcus TaxID=1298 RepID=UPI00125CB9EC|nr:YbfB/YjiJ family MFS transporter [Deinococcus sp. AJ005]QFP77077.1 YbfB/YjiJ family MFS transporter [Deinococcus sp. AJ005]
MAVPSVSTPASLPELSLSALWPTLGLALGPAVALGLARFAYALMLPAMQGSLGWNYTQAGGLNTASAVGYLLGAATGAGVGRRLGLRHAFLLGMLITALALLASGLTGNYSWMLLWRALAGVGGAVTFVTGGALAAELASRFNARSGGLIVGGYFGGVGLGIMASGAVVPALLAAGVRWEGAWWAVGALALAACAYSWRSTVGMGGRVAGAGGGGVRLNLIPLTPTLISYFLFGAGYVSYMTFVIAFLRGEGLGSGAVAAFWIVLGAAVVASSWVWRDPIARWPTRQSLALILLVLAIGTALPLASAALLPVFVSGILFGGCFLAVIAAITALVRRTLPGAVWASALGAATATFSAGQVLGPIWSGWLSDITGTLNWGLLGSALLLLIGAAVATGQREKAST